MFLKAVAFEAALFAAVRKKKLELILGRYEIEKKRIIFTIPNLLSAFRICLIPLFVWLYCTKQNYLWPAAVLLLSGITDIADGFIARRFDMESALGRVLDPAADKLTQGAVLLCLLPRYPVMLMLLLALIVKEIQNGVTGMMIIWKKGLVCGAERHGKAAAFVLYAMLTVHLVWYHIPIQLSDLLIGISFAMILLSMLLYAVRNMKILTGKQAETALEKRYISDKSGG